VSKINALAHKLALILASKEARGPELALARIILAGLGVKLGINFANYVK
jgi:hypothetical protein